MLPDYDHCIINTTMSILKNYGVKTNYKTNEIIDDFLSKNNKNTIFLILDGMGYNFLKKNFKTSFLFNHVIDKVTSVYPCTTTAAIKSYLSGLTPIEHGWIGWCPFFENVNMHVQLLPYIDDSTYFTPKLNIDLRKKLKFRSIFSLIHDTNPLIDLHTLQPSNIKEKYRYVHRHSYNSQKEMFEKLDEIINNGKRNFIYTYSPNPDSLMHEFSPNNERVILYFQNFINDLKVFIEKEFGQDVTLIISADHGQTTINRYFPLYANEELLSCLRTHPSIEGRFTAFHLKENQEKKFVELFNESYAKDFILYASKDFLKTGILGDKKPKLILKNFLGDFVALAKSDAMFLKKIDDMCMLGHHAGLLEDEMVVPIIAFNLKTSN